jgi:hypothetical protein
MRKVALIIYLACASIADAQVIKVDHFYAYSTNAPELFEMFKNKFKLPLIYDYQEFGNVSGGGLWLGNVTLGFVNYRGLGPEKALFKGLALEPVQHTDTITQILDDLGVVYNPPIPVRFTVDGVDKTYWTNIVLKDLTSGDIRVFICDYTDRNFLSAPKKAARKIFTEQGGGPLGIIGLRKIVVAASDIDKALQAWVSIPGAKKNGNHFRFIDGPEIVVEKAEKDGIKEIQVQVRSVEAASKFLTDNQMLSTENKITMIDPGKVFGLRIVLEQ